MSDSIWIVAQVQGGQVVELTTEAAQNLMKRDQARLATDDEIENADEINAKILYPGAILDPKKKKKSKAKAKR